MNDVLWDIFWFMLIILFAFCATFLIFGIVIGIINICKDGKPKKKYYLIKYEFYCKREIIMKAQSPLKARLKFQREYPSYDVISIEEIEDE